MTKEATKPNQGMRVQGAYGVEAVRATSSPSTTGDLEDRRYLARRRPALAGLGDGTNVVVGLVVASQTPAHVLRSTVLEVFQRPVISGVVARPGVVGVLVGAN